MFAYMELIGVYMKNKRKFIVIIIGVAIIFMAIIFTYIISNKNKETIIPENNNKEINYSYKIEDMELSSMLDNEIKSKGYGKVPEFYNKDFISGEIEKDTGGGVLTTKGVFYYDYSKLTIKYFDFKGNVNYFINYNNKAYYILENDDVSSYSWQLIENNIELTSPKVLMTGHDSGLNGNPVMFIENDKLYFVYADDIFNKSNKLVSQEFSIYQIGDNLTKTKLLNYGDKGEYAYDTFDNNHSNDHLYYKTVNGSSYNVYSLDLSTMKSELVTSLGEKRFIYFDLNGKYAIATDYQDFAVYDGENQIFDKQFSGSILVYKISDTKLLIDNGNNYYIYNVELNNIVEIDFGDELKGSAIRSYKDNTFLLDNNGTIKSLTIEY